MDANDLRAARFDADAEEGELLQPRELPPAAAAHHEVDRALPGEEGRWKARSRSRSRSPSHRHHQKQRQRLPNRSSRSTSPPAHRRRDGKPRESRNHRRSRSPYDDDRGARRNDRGGRDRDRGRRESPNDGREFSKRRHHEGDRKHDAHKRKEESEDDEDDEAFQARVAASLAAQEEDEERLIEERRRRRQEILERHRQQQQQQQETAEPPHVQEHHASTATATEKEEEDEEAEENDEEEVVAELGLEEGGTLNIWSKRIDSNDNVDMVSEMTSVPASGIGEAPSGEELERRLHAAAAGHLQYDGTTEGTADAAAVPPPPPLPPPQGNDKEDHAENDDEDDDDMFAETPEDLRQAEQGKAAIAAAAIAGGAAGGGAAVRRGLVDSYDDAEGYYNFQVGEIIGERYEVFRAHGRGVFSSVLKARDLQGITSSTSSPPPEVAIKVIRSNETMYKAGQMEKIILRKLAEADPEGKRHCIRLLGSFEYRAHLCLVFEPMDMDLRGLTKRYGRGIGLSLSAVRIYSQQMLVALHHLRNCGVLHADLKPDNLLVNERRTVVKICDFGSAMFAGDNELTPYLVSRFYRAPEVILGLPYDHPMDMWSIGCVVYELFTGQILFPGRTNNEMLKLMMEAKGPFQKRLLKKAEFSFKHFEADPNMSFALLEEDAVTKRPVRRLIPNPQIKKDFAGLLAGLDPDRKKIALLADLLERMMALDPDKRITPKEALKHPFIREVVPPPPPKKVLPAAPRSVMAAAAASRK